MDCDGHIGSIFRKGHRPASYITGAISLREYGFRHHIGTQRQFPGFGIAVGIGRANDILIIGRLIHSSEIGSAQILTIGVCLVDLNEARGLHLRQINVVPCGGF